MLLLDAMQGKRVSRAPSVPKIWVDLAANLLAREYPVLMGDPVLASKTVVEAAIACQCDGARIFLFPSREVRKEGGGYMLMGGVNTLSFLNKTPAEIRAEAEKCIEEGFTGNGHYAVGSGCVVPRAAKRENITALAEASKRMERS